MKQIMKPRSEAGKEYFDAAFDQCYQRIEYPKDWLDEGKQYKPWDAYVISHPSWFSEDIPEIPELSIYDLFKTAAERFAENEAVIFFDRPVTYAALDDLIGKYAAFLKDLGIGKGDVIATMLPNSLQHIVAFYAAAKIGAIHTPVNVMYQAEEIAYQIEDAGAEHIFILDIFYSRIKALHDTGILKNVITTNLKDFSSPDAVVPDAVKPIWSFEKTHVPGTFDFFENIGKFDPLDEKAVCNPRKDTAILLYTAGTTGKSKGVIETHFNLVFNSLSHTHGFRDWEGREVNFSVMPMFHTAGYLLHLLPAIYQGGTVIPVPMFDLKDAFRVIEKYGVNVIFAPPTLFIALMSRPELMKTADLSSLKLTIGCGAPVPVAVQEKWLENTGAKLVNGWGMTETNSGGIMSIPGVKAKAEAIGIPVFAETKIVNDTGEIQARNVEGEICYRGHQVASGYLNKPEETAQAFGTDGWLHTGDRGYIDDEDFVHFIDRIKDLIVAAGYNIAPVEVENAIYKHPSVAEAAVIGVPDGYRGETVKAVVALKPEFKDKVTGEEIIALCRKHLATFKVPKIVEFRDSLPKSAVGKILRRKLR
ncbi:MAG: AMP-binding protein [Desulfobacterales bacterium]|nr:AMP-binding protein [Desulfobacterales bacterium]